MYKTGTLSGLYSEYKKIISEEFLALEKRLNNLEKSFGFDIEHSYLLFKKEFCSTDTQINFCNKLVAERCCSPRDLELIADIADKYKNGQLLCVISFDDFFNEEKGETDEMALYFARYYRPAQENSIKRIFTIPGKGKKEAGYKSSLGENKDIILLKYLLVNRSCKVDTYLLIYDESKPLGFYDFIPKSDYVLGYPHIDQRAEFKNSLYFAYTESKEGKNQMICTEDLFLIKVFDKDFSNRMKKLNAQGINLRMIKFDFDNFNEILSMLNINSRNKNHRKKLNEEIDDLTKFLKGNKKYKVADSLNSWKHAF